MIDVTLVEGRYFYRLFSSSKFIILRNPDVTVKRTQTVECSNSRLQSIVDAVWGNRVTKMEQHRWSCLESGLIEQVVFYLKATQRWKRDGRSLRLINRHWCLEIDRHIFSVEPHASREIAAQDLPSLLKFSRLVSLDATRFVREYEAENFPSLGILKRLPHLSRLKLASDRWNGIGLPALIALPRIQSLCLQTQSQTHVTQKDLHFLSRLPLKELSIRCPLHRMEPFFRRCRSLECLDAQVYPGDVRFPYDASLFNGLKCLKLTFRTAGHSFELPDLGFLSSVRSLTDIDVMSFCSEDLDWSVHLSHLRSLKIAVASVDVLSTVAFLHTLQRLAVFHVRSSTSQSLDMGHVIRHGTQLQFLHLNGFKVDCQLIKEHVQKLESLVLDTCCFQNSQFFFMDLKPLKQLAFHCVRDPFASLCLGSAVLTRLTVLKLPLKSVDAVITISRLKQLTCLGLRTCYPLSTHALQQLGTLPSLMTFGVSPPFPESSVSLFMSSDMMRQLELLYLPGACSIIDISSHLFFKEAGRHLKIETESEVFESFMRAV